MKLYKIKKSKIDNKKMFNLKTVLKKLYTLGVRNLLVEGGDKITKNLIQNRLIDKFYLFKSPKNLLINEEHMIFTSLNTLNSKYKNKTRISPKLAKDNITIYKR